MNSKQIVAIVSIFALVIILVYPALSTGTVTVLVRSVKIESAEHVYVTVNDVWAHQAGQESFEGWKLLSNQSQTIDLVSLENSTTTLGKGQLSLANYDSIRIEISNVTWAFNNTNTKLQVQSTLISANVNFTVIAGKESLITLVLGGHQEDIAGTKYFVSSLNSTISTIPQT